MGIFNWLTTIGESITFIFKWVASTFNKAVQAMNAAPVILKVLNNMEDFIPTWASLYVTVGITLTVVLVILGRARK